MFLFETINFFVPDNCKIDVLELVFDTTGSNVRLVEHTVHVQDNFSAFIGVLMMIVLVVTIAIIQRNTCQETKTQHRETELVTVNIKTKDEEGLLMLIKNPP
jgi:hypothetical protein